MDDILYNYSWVNLMMLIISIPKNNKDEDKKQKDKHEIKDAGEFMRLMG